MSTNPEGCKECRDYLDGEADSMASEVVEGLVIAVAAAALIIGRPVEAGYALGAVAGWRLVNFALDLIWLRKQRQRLKARECLDED